MYLKELTIEGFKSFGKEVTLSFPSRITGVVGPNGSGKSNVTEAFRFVLGEQSMKSMRGKRGEDLIFNGGSGGTRAQRARVGITFDNSDRRLHDAFDQVTVSRTVYRDGLNEYRINDTQVRHRDVVALLAQIGIGATGHHIISQGESDRILHCSPEERKEMLEDGLGLKVLQYQRIESEKKLAKSQKNIAEADLLLREITPHMRHLKRQVDRYEKAQVVRQELEHLYTDYLVREERYLTVEQHSLKKKHAVLEEKLVSLEKDVAREQEHTAGFAADEFGVRMRGVQKEIQDIRTEKDAVARRVGRIEGERDALASLRTPVYQEAVSRSELVSLRKEIHRRTEDKEVPEGILAYIIEQLTRILDGVSAVQGSDSSEPEEGKSETTEQRRGDLEGAYAEEQKRLEEVTAAELDAVSRYETLRQQQKESIHGIQESERRFVAVLDAKNTAERELSDVEHVLSMLDEDTDAMRREVEEGFALIGSAVHVYKKQEVSEESEHEDRSEQKKRRHLLERKKIELETMGTDSGDEVRKEYAQVSERVEFLNRERKDLLASIEDCQECIARIQSELDTRFTAGIKKIGVEFETFFKILFGGGTAGIKMEKRQIQREDDSSEERIGVTVHVVLPRKKIHSLEQLSGGERALVSTALLFAISQVTPPPFLVLDETDAALDEANSRRYASMIASLAEKSQLIVVTHNRETMYCADTLYGVTMGATGVSTLLSVQFDEAIQVAK